MEKVQKKIVGIGSALVDILVRMKDDHLLDVFHLPKGSMTLIDAELSRKMMELTSKEKRSLETGGSAANTIRGIAQLGGETGFIGKIADDEIGHFFKSEFEKVNIRAHLFFSQLPTGQATTLISTDSERTFGTYLGAASELNPEDFSVDLFKDYDYLHVEGYLIFNHRLIECAMKTARKAGLKISLDLASFNVVEENLDFLNYLVENYVDIVFANEEEARAFTQKEPQQAVEAIANKCTIAVVKMGEKGSLIRSEKQTITVEAIKATPVDTTGAGDVYASGFLYGLANSFSLNHCGELGSLLAGSVIQHTGAKISDEFWPVIINRVNELHGY